MLHYIYGVILNKNGSGTAFKPLFFEFHEGKSLSCENQFLIGSNLMVAPALDVGERVSVYFPKDSKWIKFDLNKGNEPVKAIFFL